MTGRDELLAVGPRPRLSHALRPAGRRRVCVVTAAAGWGKTTSVREHGDPDNTVWVSLGTPGRGDLAERVRSAISDLVEGEPADQQPLYSWLHSLRPDIAAVLIVDGLERITPDSSEARQLRDVCLHGPDWLSLVLLSRQPLPFSLESLRGQGGMSELGAEDLGYSETEIETLVRATVGEDPRALAHLVWRATGGWPGAVDHLIGLLRDIPLERRVSVVERFATPGEPFHRYVLEQVLGEETADSRDDLRSLAACAHRGGAAVPCPAWEQRLIGLARRGLVRAEADRGWELVPPLRDHFALELRRAPRTRTALHRGLSRHCGEQGALSPALGHAVASGDPEVCATLLATHGAVMVQAGVAEDVQRIASIDVTTWKDPTALRIVGQARQVRGQWVAALAAFRDAGADREMLEPALAWRVAQLACDRGEIDEALQACARSDPRGERTADGARVLALAAAARRLVGDHADVGALVERAEAAASASGDAGAHAAVYLAASTHAACSGDLVRAEAYRTGALDAAARAGDVLQELRIRVVTLEQWTESRDPLGSREEADAAVRLGRRCGDVCATALALTMRGRAALRAGSHEDAAADFTEARGALERMGSRLLVRPLCGLADVHRLRGQRARALAAYERALELSERSHDTVGRGAALVGIARVTAAEDLASAFGHVDRAVASGETTCAIPALVTRGWLRLLDGDARAALRDAARAAELARTRGEEVGIAESLVLRVLAADEPTRERRRLPEAVQVWQEAGCGVEAAAALVVAGRLSPGSDPEAARAAEFLRDCGVDVQTRQVAGPLQASAHRSPPITVRTLGTFQVWRDGVAVPVAEWKSRKARDLLKILVAHRRPVSREALRELLWPEVAPGKSANRLSVLLFTLREVLQPSGRAEDGPVAGDGTAVWLDRSLVEIDVEAFLARSWAALDLHRRGGEAALEAMLGAERLYTGVFLEEDTGQPWAVSLAEEVASTWWSLLSALAVCWETAGDTDNAARCLVRLLDVDIYDERVHLDLVALLQRAGRFGAARRRHTQYVQRMMEIGVEPRPAPVGREPGSMAVAIPGQR
ncbi:BTAD domain-containing putative transcriptional regulator [Allosaccharopolyspora coralli]|nr:BTAD domain-containing putative transcriptional regulator [Allosaccharopolyspora coralli]